MRSNKHLWLGAILAFALPASAVAGETQGVIVHTAKPYDQVITAIEQLGGTVTFQYKHADGLAAEIPLERFSELQGISGVDFVEKDLIVPLPEVGGESHLQPQAASELEIRDIRGIDLPDTYASYTSQLTAANQVWADTNFGAGSTVAVIDTGTFPDPVCGPNVIAGPDFSTDAGGAFDGSTRPDNHWHGTFVGGVVALPGICAIFDAAGGPFESNLPAEAKIPFGGGFIIPLIGIAPGANIYAIKVFPHTGAGASSSRINMAIDHAIDAKVTGAVDIDVINMSLGGGTLFDGRTVQEQLVDAATDAGILVSISAGNEGPAPNSIARPATAFSALSVGAVEDPIHTRIRWDAAFGVGAGAILRPDDRVMPFSFSNRGPTADGRSGPSVTATGVFNFSVFTPVVCGSVATVGCIGWASGTSFSAPIASGVGALLNAWGEANGKDFSGHQLRNAIIDGAVPVDFGSIQDQGTGYVNAANSLALLQSGMVNNGLKLDHKPLKPNVLKGNQSTGTWHVSLNREETASFVFEIDENTESVDIAIDVIGGPIPPGPAGAVFPNSFELYVKSAKHGGFGNLVDTMNVFDDTTITIGDGSITGPFGGTFGALLAPAPMEPGLMKVVIEADWTNNLSPIAADVTITRNQGPGADNAAGFITIGDEEFQCFTIDLTGVTTATFELGWRQNWSQFPTNDLDLLFASPSSFPFIDLGFLDAATINSPERQVINSPEAGVWFACVNGFTVHRGRDTYDLQVDLQ